MLYLTRRPGEAVIINNAIEVRVVELKGKSVKLGFTFPSDATVLREEVFLQIKAENEAAVAASAEVLRARPDQPRSAVASEADSDSDCAVEVEPAVVAGVGEGDRAVARPPDPIGRHGATDRVPVTAGGGDACRPDDS